MEQWLEDNDIEFEWDKAKGAYRVTQHCIRVTDLFRANMEALERQMEQYQNNDQTR